MADKRKYCLYPRHLARPTLQGRRTIFDWSVDVKGYLVFRLYIYWLTSPAIRAKGNVRMYHVALFNYGWWL